MSEIRRTRSHVFGFTEHISAGAVYTMTCTLEGMMDKWTDDASTALGACGLGRTRECKVWGAGRSVQDKEAQTGNLESEEGGMEPTESSLQAARFPEWGRGGGRSQRAEAKVPRAPRVPEQLGPPHCGCRNGHTVPTRDGWGETVTRQEMPPQARNLRNQS